MNIESQIHLFELKLKRHKINFYKENQGIVIKSAIIDVSQLLIYVLFPLIFGIIVLIAIVLFIIFYGIYIPRIHLVYGLAFVSGFALIGFAFASFGRIQKKKKENQASKILLNRKLIIKTKNNETTYDAANVVTVQNSIEVHEDSILMGNVFLVDTAGNNITIISLEGFKSNHLRNDLVWFENFFKNYMELKA